MYRSDVGRRVLRIAVDPHNLNAVTRELLAKLLQAWPIKTRQRAFRSQEANDLPLCVGNRDRPVLHVAQAVPTDVDWFGCGTRFGAEQAEQQGDECA